MVEAYRESREEFVVMRHSQGAFLHHEALKRDNVLPADIRALERYGFLQLAAVHQHSQSYDLTPTARRYHEWLKQQDGKPTERLDTEVRRLLDANTSRDRHPGAHDRWANAEAKLWEAEAAKQEFTDIGLVCREAVQLLVTDLVEKHAPPDVDPNPEKTIKRLKSVTIAVGSSDRVAHFAEALVAYFDAVNGLFHRQAHGMQKSGLDTPTTKAISLVRLHHVGCLAVRSVQSRGGRRRRAQWSCGDEAPAHQSSRVGRRVASSTVLDRTPRDHRR